jgi:nucleoid-associated protein
MELKINHVVIHEIIKQQHKDPLPLVPTDVVLPPENETVIKLVKGVAGLYSKKNNSAHYGVFKSGKDRGNFPDAFIQYFENDKNSDKTFMDLSLTVIGELYRLVEGQQSSSGGNILVVDCEIDTYCFFLVAMLKNTDGISLTTRKSGVRDPKVLVLEELEQIDLNTLHQAARINLGKFQEYVDANDDEQQEINYLSFVSPSSSKSASGYFVAALGCSKGTASATATEILITESVNFFRKDAKLRDKRLDYKDDLLRYLNDCQKRGYSVKLSRVDALARNYFPADEEGMADQYSEALHEELNSEKNSIPAEFPISKSVLQKHSHIKYKSDRWQLLFDRDSLGTNENSEIRYLKRDSKLIISNLPAELREIIEDELRDSNKLD